jgi:hypothetical protein
MDTIMQILQFKLEEIAGWFLCYTTQEGILQYQTIANGNTSANGRYSNPCRRAARSKLEDMECQQAVEQIKVECQVFLEEQSVEVEKTNAKMTRFGSRVRGTE